ncbi:hypothetical protein BD311DRAFT_741345 [Dichomitus squalens]|uniref:Uncharacterized protein n=1 Tax=Dichomitus squalens TaxID=114155 RepID=A0A4Q9MD24_9APHY|nr:hypothetical protein BD311DRAFT_741345 [Dichomitus squalens]
MKRASSVQGDTRVKMSSHVILGLGMLSTSLRHGCRKVGGPHQPGHMNVGMEDSGVSGRPGVWDEEKTGYGGNPVCVRGWSRQYMLSMYSERGPSWREANKGMDVGLAEQTCLASSFSTEAFPDEAGSAKACTMSRTGDNGMHAQHPERGISIQANLMKKKGKAGKREDGCTSGVAFERQGDLRSRNSRLPRTLGRTT